MISLVLLKPALEVGSAWAAPKAQYQQKWKSTDNQRKLRTESSSSKLAISVLLSMPFSKAATKSALLDAAQLFSSSWRFDTLMQVTTMRCWKSCWSRSSTAWNEWENGTTEAYQESPNGPALPYALLIWSISTLVKLTRLLWMMHNKTHTALKTSTSMVN